ncbi:hypothetical protein BB560_001835 [Smittium megazygosporum]|uniref:NLE domain-containing protein n=1 Tax=Smittium megazygosporum TaxID=133381 RepID=A0A2T9ZGM3_9FUNG|nr:hypothetical protein BB560_001835 [Smittium megazygosporum]
MDHHSESQIQAVFVSKIKKFELPATPILIPAKLRRQGLSEIVNHLLGNETQIPFDFLINNTLLKSSVAEYLSAKSISTENIITLEFIESIKPPSDSKSFSTDSWISSVAIHPSKLYYVANYDSTIQIWNDDAECITKLSGHTGPVKSLALINTNNTDTNSTTDDTTLPFMLSGGLDQTIIAWSQSIGSGETPSHSPIYTAFGHIGSVDCIVPTLDNAHFISASSDSFIKLWSSSTPSEDSQRELFENGIQGLPPLESLLPNSLAKKQKKSHKDSSSSSTKPFNTLIKTCESTFKGHVGPVTSISVNSSSSFFSAGSDNSLRTWDIPTGDCINTKVADTSFLDIQFSPSSNIIISGHTDRFIRHSNWVKSLKWSPSNTFMFASASYDSSVKIWDIRSNSFIFNIPCIPSPKSANNNKTPKSSSTEKLLSLDWNNNTIAAGGESGDLFINSI